MKTRKWEFKDLSFGRRLLLKDGTLVTYVKGLFGNIAINPMMTVKFDNGEQKTISVYKNLSEVIDENLNPEYIIENKEYLTNQVNRTSKRSAYNELKEMIDKNFIDPKNAINDLKKTDKYKLSGTTQKNALIRTMYKIMNE